MLEEKQNRWNRAAIKSQLGRDQKHFFGDISRQAKLQLGLTAPGMVRQATLGPGQLTPRMSTMEESTKGRRRRRLSLFSSFASDDSRKVMPEPGPPKFIETTLQFTPPGGQPTEVEVRCEYSGCKHTLYWKTHIGNGGATTTSVRDFEAAPPPASPKGSRDANAPASLAPGSINLYAWPLVTPPADAQLPDFQPSAAQATILEALLIELLVGNGEACKYYEAEDDTGAKPIHGLLIANTESAIRVCTSVIKTRPERMLDAHGKGSFHGENCMHVLCVQQREDALLECFDVCAEKLPRSEIIRLLSMQANGDFFFANTPVDLYGCTPLSYACVCGMKRIIIRLLLWSREGTRDAHALLLRKSPSKRGSGVGLLEDAPDAAAIEHMATTRRQSLEASNTPSQQDLEKAKKEAEKEAAGHTEVDLNDYVSYACRYTGFLLIHCVVACKMPKMVEWLLTLPDHPELWAYRANLHLKVAIGNHPAYAQHTPLQLAARLGDREMVRYILARHSKVEWTWGSLTQKRFDLSEIDSINHGANNVMELVCRDDALPKSQEMLGLGGKRDFMQGFLFALFENKYNMFSYYISYVNLIIDVGYLTSLIYVAYFYREFCGHGVPISTYSLLILVIIEFIYELFILRMSIKNALSGNEKAQRLAAENLLVTILDDVVPFKAASQGLSRVFDFTADLRRVQWLKLFKDIKSKLLSLVISIFLIIFLFLVNAQGSDPTPRSSSTKPTYYAFLDLMRDGVPLSWHPEWPICSPTAPQPDVISFLVSLAFFFHSLYVVTEFLPVIGKAIGMESLGKYVRFIIGMGGALVNWFIMFGLFLILFSYTMHIMYPVVPQFRAYPDAIIGLWMLATTGEPLDEFPPRFPLEGLSGSLNGIFFFILYVAWIYIALVLLLNLVIALMSDEFDTLKSKATLEYRLDFARRVLRAELLATSFFGHAYAARKLRVGKEEGGKHYYTFVLVGRNAEGKKVQEGDDIFADYSDSEDEYDHDPSISKPPVRRG